MLELIEQLHQNGSHHNLKRAPDNSFYTPLTVEILGYKIGNNTMQPISSIVKDVQKLETPTSITELLRFTSYFNVYTIFIHKLQISFKFSHPLLHEYI